MLRTHMFVTAVGSLAFLVTAIVYFILFMSNKNGLSDVQTNKHMLATFVFSSLYAASIIAAAIMMS